MPFVLCRPQAAKGARPVPGIRPHAATPWQSALMGPHLLEAGNSDLDEKSLRTRMTPTGLPEQDLLAAFNYLDESAIQDFPGIGPKIAEGILNWRTQQGYIGSLDDLIDVPLIGEKRFETLVGRACQRSYNALHHLLRLDWKESVREQHLRPWNQPAKGLERIFLGEEADRVRERRLAQERAWQLKERGVFQRRLFFHFVPEQISGRARFLFRRLPTLLRAAYQDSLIR
jgi:hypothetical protein